MGRSKWVNPIRPRVALVVVEYDCAMGKVRKRKEFTHNGKARSFFEAKEKEGRNPKVVRAKLEGC